VTLRRVIIAAIVLAVLWALVMLFFVVGHGSGAAG
jgi:hypothetical protein